MTNCPTREQLTSWIARRSRKELSTEVGLHALSCPRCRQFLAEFSRDGAAELGRAWPDVGETIEPTNASLVSALDPLLNALTRLETIDVGPSPADILPALAASFPARTDETIAMPFSLAETFPDQDAGPHRGASWAVSSPAADLDSPRSGGEAEPSGEATEFGWDRFREDPRRVADVDSSNDTTDSGEIPSGRSGSVFGTAETFLATIGTFSGPCGVTSPDAKRGPTNYTIVRELGRGGMGVVYKALDQRLNRLVALKMIRGADHAGEIQLARFKIEAEAVASLHHPNILQIYDIGEFDGSPYVALELLEGGSLLDRLRRTAISARRAAEWLIPLAMAMDTAHRAGIVHRDLKSANILFSSDDVPKITDFGLAKRLEADEGQTRTGQVMGTPSYMAPEQARGETKSVGPAADIYALGTILYEMLTGRPPFKGISAMDTVKQVIEVDPISPSRIQVRVPRDLETICMKCLQKEPTKRYATAKELADDLSRYMLGEPIRARRTPPIERCVKWSRRRPTVATLLALGSIMVIAAIGAGAWYANHRRIQERIAAQHESALRDETAEDLIRAREAISNNDLSRGQVILTARKAVLEREHRPGLSGLHDRTTQMLGQVERALEAERAREAERQAKDEVLARYRRFLDRREEALFRDTQFAGLMLSPALFRDTQFTGLMLPTNLDLARKAAEEALGVFAHRGQGDDWALGDLSALSGEERAQVVEGCYELLLVLAEAVATQDPAQVERAMQSLESARLLRPALTRAYHLRMAACLARKGDQDGEARELAEAGRIVPESAFDHFLSGQQLYKRGRLPEAIQHFESALRLKADHFWAGCLLAICYFQTTRFEAAKSCLNASLQTEPDFAWLYLLRGFASGQIAARYLGLVPSSPGREGALKAAAEFEFEEAEADLREATSRLKRTPDDDLRYQLLVNRGLIRFQRGHLDDAASDYREAIALKKDPFLAHAELAHIYEKRGNTAAAIEEFTKAIALRPDWSPLYRGRAEARQNAANPSPKDRAAALADLEMAIRHEKPGNLVQARDHTNRGRLFYQEERLDDALEESRLALSVLPDYVDAHVLRIQALLRLRRYGDVIRSCDAALATARKSPLLFELRGLARAAQDDYSAAILDYSRALEIRPDDGQLLVRRGWAYLVADSPRLALDDFNAAIKLDPANGDAYNGRGTAHVRLGDHRAAVADAREALRLGGEMNPRVTYDAARIYAMAAPVASAEIGENGRTSRLLPPRYQDIAVQLIRNALARETPEKRESFWRETIQNDPALKAIRRRLKFEEWNAENKKASS
jgi:eukaryotic-like serine/threonine-protein kinase